MVHGLVNGSMMNKRKIYPDEDDDQRLWCFVGLNEATMVPRLLFLSSHLRTAIAIDQTGCFVSTDQSLGDVNWIFFLSQHAKTLILTGQHLGNVESRTTLALAVTVIPFRKMEQVMRDHTNTLDNMKKEAVRKHEQIRDLVAANMLNKDKKERCFNWDVFFD